MVEQGTYRWYGRSVGDYPLPEGFTETDPGKCEYALRVKDANHARTYEVGVVPRKDGKPGYTLLWDFYMGGYGLQDAVGEGGTKLADAYAEAVIMQECKKKGLKVKRQVTEDGRILLEATGGR